MYRIPINHRNTYELVPLSVPLRAHSPQTLQPNFFALRCSIAAFPLLSRSVGLPIDLGRQPLAVAVLALTSDHPRATSTTSQVVVPAAAFCRLVAVLKLPCHLQLSSLLVYSILRDCCSLFSQFSFRALLHTSTIRAWPILNRLLDFSEPPSACPLLSHSPPWRQSVRQTPHDKRRARGNGRDLWWRLVNDCLPALSAVGVGSSASSTGRRAADRTPMCCVTVLSPRREAGVARSQKRRQDSTVQPLRVRRVRQDNNGDRTAQHND